MRFHPRDTNYYNNLENNASLVFNLLEKNINVNTFFLTLTDFKYNYFIQVFNRHDTLVEAGEIMPYEAIF
ncbi:hypothetical protein FZW96_06800 [Bacillus sp. BGMRC 2118]|nr:hypothetical protein FZW96_06800 [Bacillus sp. BGMRC 2118]